MALLGRAPDTYAESFTLAAEVGMIHADLASALRPSAGMRNVLVHNYLAVDQERVAGAASVAADRYAAYIRQVADFVAGHAD